MNKAYLKFQRRTALYRLPAEVARAMYKGRSARDKNVPFKQYILQVVNEDAHAIWPITELDLY